MTFPVSKPHRITTRFSKAHPGIDIAPPPGVTNAKALAPEKGEIIVALENPELEGKYVIMKSRRKFYYFGHLSKHLAWAGDKVKEGQAIGVIGSTGQSTGVHLHYEVRNAMIGSQINPVEWHGKDDMYKGKTAKQHYEEKLAYIKRAKKLATALGAAKKALAANPAQKVLEQIKKLVGKG